MEFTNTFDKGMNSDMNVIYQPDGTYRYAKNCQIISQDGNNYTIKDVLGNIHTFTINTAYTSYDPIGGVTYQIKPMPIGFISFPDVLVVFSTNTVGGPSGIAYGEIGLLYYKQYGEGIEPTDMYSPSPSGNPNFHTGYQVLYHHASLNFSNLHKIEGFAFPENNLIKRVYWTDNFNEPRVFNIADTIFTTYYTGAADLTVGTQYMVLEGVIEHPVASATYYGPGLTTGNVFTATTSSYTDKTTPNPKVKVIKYYDYRLLTWTPDRTLGNINFSSYGTGSVNCGHKVYFYRVGKLSAGIYSSWSYCSAPIHVGMANDSGTLTGNAYHDFVGAGSSSTLVNSFKSVKVSIDNIDTFNDVIQLGVAEFDQSLSTPYNLAIVNQSTITSSSIVLEHNGTTNLGTLTLSDITLFPASILKIKTLTTNKNYNLIGNITERDEFTEETTVTSLASFEYPLIEQGDNDTCSNLEVFDNVAPSVGARPGVNQVFPNSRWYVTLGNLGADTVTYNGVSYITGDVIVGVTGFYTITYGSVTAQVRPCVNNSKYTAINSTTTSFQRNNPVQFDSTVYGFWDYKNPAVDEKIRGYWSNEKYRIGILYFDLKGNPFYVRHLQDYTFPTIYNKTGGGLLREDITVGGAGNLLYSLNPSGLKISIDIPTSLVGQVSGFSIVRSERDARIITQGWVDKMVYAAGPPVVEFPLPGLTFSTLALYGATPAQEVYTYICPDHLIDVPLKKAVGVVGDKMEEACWISPYDFTGAATPYTWYKSYGDVQSVVVKMTGRPGSDANSLQVVSLNDCGGVGWISTNETEYVVNWTGASGTDFNNRVETAAGGFYPNNGCTGGVPDMGTLRGGPSAKKLIWRSGDALYYWNTNNPYSTTDGVEKILMNYCKNILPADQYGGSGDAAIADTEYISTGHYQPINATVLADTYALKLVYTVSAGVLILNETITGGTSGATGVIRVINGTTLYIGTVTGTFVNGETITGGTSAATGVITSNEFVYHFEGMEVWGGDCYTCWIDQAYVLYDNGYPTATAPPSYGLTYFFPCECNSNYNLRRGRKASNSYVYPASAAGNSIVWDDGGGNTRLEDYSYNPSYSAEGQMFKYPALPLSFINASNFPVRVRYAGVKFFGELIDSFRVFLTNDYKDLNGQSGEINNIRERDGRVIVWQNYSVVTVPVLERQLLGAASGAATTIGTGDVADRFDPLNSFHGNQHQHGLTITEYGFLWFDMRNKCVVAMDMGGGIIEVSKIARQQGYFNEAFLENTGTYQGTTAMINDPLWDITSDMPLVGVGVVGVYEPKLKMTYLTFKFVQRMNDGITESYINKDFTICYYHTDKCFTEFVDCTPAIWHNHNQIVIATKRPMNPTKYYGPGMASTSFVVGDIVRGATDNIEYICTAAVTITTYDPSVNTDPTYAGNVYWTVVNSTDQIWVLNQPTTLGQTTAPGYQYNKYFGIVVDNVFDYVVSPKKGVISVTNYEAGQVGDNITDITTTADNSQTGTVSSIQSWNRSYQYKDGSWWGEYPLNSTTSRITDKYLKVRMTKHNWVTNPTVEAGLRFVVQYIKSFFFPKR